MPDIEDFFRFIDVSERHPFSGTGSLVNFAEGLAKIDVQNQVVFLFDNDSEGWAAFEKVQGLTLPQNMSAMVLPDVEDFRAFPGIGPHGVLPSDINRRAAGIECYLDLRLEGRLPRRFSGRITRKIATITKVALSTKRVTCGRSWNKGRIQLCRALTM